MMTSRSGFRTHGDPMINRGRERRERRERGIPSRALRVVQRREGNEDDCFSSRIYWYDGK